MNTLLLEKNGVQGINLVNNDSGFDEFDGDDLRFATPEERLQKLLSDIDQLAKALERGDLRAKDVNWQHHEDIAMDIHDHCQAYRDEMIATDEDYAGAIRDWVVEELKLRHPDYLTNHGQDDPDQAKVFERLLSDLDETIEVISKLEVELVQDDEDQRLVNYAKTWRIELLADLQFDAIRSLYRQAA